MLQLLDGKLIVLLNSYSRTCCVGALALMFVTIRVKANQAMVCALILHR